MTATEFSMQQLLRETTLRVDAKTVMTILEILRNAEEIPTVDHFRQHVDEVKRRLEHELEVNKFCIICGEYNCDSDHK